MNPEVIYSGLEHIRRELDLYVKSIDPAPDATPSGPSRVELGNISQVEATTEAPDRARSIQDKIVMTLVNVEEEKTLRNGPAYVIQNGNTYKTNPPLHLNLYVLFCANRSNYEYGLKSLSKVVSFFQKKNVFNRQTSPALDAGIDKLILDLYSLSFENLNHMWGILGGKQLPSVMYRIRLVTVQSEPDEQSGVIEVIGGNENVL